MEFSDKDASSRIELENGIVLTRCDQCREMWRERNERGVAGGPECKTCKVELLPDNQAAAEVYLMCRGQVITRNRGMEGDVVTDISLPAIAVTMEALGVINQRDCLIKVRHVFHHFLRQK